ncbi:MAG: hypothetical protein H0W78_07985 [Planctomycetes bacterium]|nr:hypothetical protein [Planctomycetota bacterium]
MSKSLMTLAMSVGIGGCLGLFTAAPALGEDLKIAEFDYIRLQASIGAVEAPDVEEDSNDNNNVNTNYEWNGGRESGYQAALTVILGRGRMGEGGWQWGGEVVYGHYNITPDSFSVNGTVFSNGSGNELKHQTIGINLLGGYQWGLSDITEFTGFVEIMPHIGGGVAFAENEVHLLNGGYEENRGIGAYWEVGVRVGAYITEQRFIYGFNVSYAYGGAEMDMDFAGGFSSELHITRQGFGIAGVAGYRF